jgi:hypothetical protein
LIGAALTAPERHVPEPVLHSLDAKATHQYELPLKLHISGSGSMEQFVEFECVLRSKVSRAAKLPDEIKKTENSNPFEFGAMATRMFLL